MARDCLAIAERMRQLDASGIRKVFDLAAKMTDPINLSIGQPDFDVPEPVKDRAVEVWSGLLAMDPPGPVATSARELIRLHSEEDR